MAATKEKRIPTEAELLKMPESAASQPSRSARFIHNVLWSWMGVVVNILLGLFLSPILIVKLGTVRFGIWIQIFSVMDYLRLLDFGLRAAVINRCARRQAQRDWVGVNTTISTAIVYFLGMSLICSAIMP